MDKNEKKRLRNEYKQQKKKEFQQSLPMNRESFEELFDYLDEKLGKFECRLNFYFTRQFLNKKTYDVDTIIEWLVDNGAGCDCEVLYNIEEMFEE